MKVDYSIKIINWKFNQYRSKVQLIKKAIRIINLISVQIHQINNKLLGLLTIDLKK